MITLVRRSALAVVLAACSGAGAGDADTSPAPDAAADSAVVPADGTASEASDAAVVAEATGPTSDDVAPEVEVDAAEPEPEPWPVACTLAEEVIDTIPLPEASGSARLGDGRIVVVADSGNEGRAVVLDPAQPDGAVAVTLPLGDGAGDDVEGLETAPDGRVWGLTSAGWLRAWRVEPGATPTFLLEVGPVAVAPEGDWRCAATGVNCGPNYEGLCLHPAPEAGACAGWAASKARGVLVCLVASEGAFAVDPTRTIAVAPADQLSGCSYEPAPPYRLVAGGNVFSGSLLWEVDVAAGRATPFKAIGAANQETVLVSPGGVIHSYGDLQELSPDSSPHITLRCPVRQARVESPR